MELDSFVSSYRLWLLGMSKSPFIAHGNFSSRAHFCRQLPISTTASGKVKRWSLWRIKALCLFHHYLAIWNLITALQQLFPHIICITIFLRYYLKRIHDINLYKRLTRSQPLNLAFLYGGVLIVASNRFWISLEDKKNPDQTFWCLH